MTAEEKAFKLVIDKYYNLNCISTIEEAKQCALIAVDEMIKEVNHSDVGYWKKVKQEIELL